jgi:hypothetical protein
MRFLKVLFWLLLGGLLAAFVIYNGDERVMLRLWGGLVVDFSLPMLMILVFLAGFLPMLLAYHALRWRMRQRLAGMERALTHIRAVAVPAAPPLPPLVPQDEAVPSPAPPLLP